MSLPVCRAQITQWSDSANWVELIDRTLINEKTPYIDEYNVAGRLSRKISNFIVDHRKFLSEELRQPLEKLKLHAKTFNEIACKIGLLDPRDRLNVLLETIETALKIIDIRPLPNDFTVKIHLAPPPEQGLTALYRCPEDYRMLNGLTDRIKGPLDLPTLKKITASFLKATPEEIQEYVAIARFNLKENRSHFERMVRTFFRHISPSRHPEFFSCLEVSEENSDFFNEVIKALPTSITHLNLKDSKFVLDSHVSIISERMKALEVLDLRGCERLTIATPEILCDGKTTNLQCLNLDPSLLTLEVTKKLEQSSNIKNLIDIGCVYANMNERVRELISSLMEKNKRRMSVDEKKDN